MQKHVLILLMWRITTLPFEGSLSSRYGYFQLLSEGIVSHICFSEWFPRSFGFIRSWCRHFRCIDFFWWFTLVTGQTGRRMVGHGPCCYHWWCFIRRVWWPFGSMRSWIAKKMIWCNCFKRMVRKPTCQTVDLDCGLGDPWDFMLWMQPNLECMVQRGCILKSVLKGHVALSCTRKAQKCVQNPSILCIRARHILKCG